MLFTPKSQLRNMLNAEIGQALCAGPNGNQGNLTKIVALSTLLNQGQSNSWLDSDDDDDYLF
jgi:hypothetical protein